MEFHPNVEHVREVEKPESRRVVRAFILQSKSINRVREEFLAVQQATGRGDHIDLKSLFLTGVLWAEKSGKSEKNPGQLTPIGGKVDKEDKGLLQAVQREILEETHLRPVRVEQMPSALEYKLQTKKEVVDIHQDFFVADVLPNDRAFPLDPEEDKIDTFHKLDLHQMGALFSSNTFLKETSGKRDQQKVLILFGNLRLPLPNIEQDASIQIPDENRDKPFEVFRQLASRAQEKEMAKRFQVIDHFLEIEAIPSKDRQALFDEFLSAQNFFEHQLVWEKFVQKYLTKSGAHDSFFAAVDLANFEEETQQNLPYESKTEAIIRFMYTLLETDYPYDGYMHLAERNPKLKDFVKRIKKFIQSFSTERTVTKGKLVDKNLAKNIAEIRDIDKELLVAEFLEAFDLKGENIPQRFDLINKFINNVVDEGINAQVGKRYQKDLVSQITEVYHAGLGKLIHYAFLPDKRVWETRLGQDPDITLMKKRIVFEARRKMTLLFLFSEVDKYYQEVIGRGNEPIEELSEKLWSFPKNPKQLTYVYRMNNEGKRYLLNVYTNGFERPEDDSFEYVEQQTILRNFIGKKGVPSFLAGMESRTKQMDSVYRKVIVRGMDSPKEVQDIYGRAFTIVPDEKDSASSRYVVERQTRSLLIDGNIVEVNDYAAVLDIVESYTKMPGVKVYLYKTTPPLGENMKSSSVGGGEIRAAKFYVAHRDESGVVRNEEIQIFSPSEDGKSAYYWKEKKKEDDKRYFLDRMLDTKGLRSFVELMFPTTIYGEPIHAMVSDKKKRGK